MKYNSPTSHPLYASLKKIKSRCYCKSSNAYIPGIEVYNEWMDYDKFYEWGIQHWFQGSVLCRKDESKNFDAENCIFVDKKEYLKENIKKAKKSIKDKYGVEYYSQTKEWAEKLKKTSLERFGTEHFASSQVVKNKVVETNLEKYGVKSTLNNPETIEKIKKTNIEKYGSENPTSHPDVQAKRRKTSMDRYGEEHPMRVDKFKQKSIDTNMEKYGIAHFNQCKGEQEKEVREFLESLTGLEFPTNCSILSGKEIDMYNDSRKFGVEYCGLIWHSEYRSGTRNSHWDKYKICEKYGVRLITLFSDEWLYRKTQVKSFLSASLGIFESRTYARQCDVKEIDSILARKFIDDYHIRKTGRKALFYAGIFNTDELIGVMSLARHHRKPTELVLDRMVFKSGIQIVGGASKLLKVCKEWAKTNGHNRITSWSDNRFSVGNVYSQMGFTMSKELYQDYSYIKASNGKNRIPKQECKKANIGCVDGQTESERMTELGYYKIWDCGKKRWVLNIS